MSALACSSIDSPVGRLLAVASDRGLCGLPFVDPDEDVLAGRWGRRLRRQFDAADLIERPDHPTLVETRDWLRQYFDGSLPGAVPALDLRGAAFERTVWRALLTIAAGTTTSYGAIARHIGSPGAARAVGLANGANPVPIIVPCHRVIGASGALTGYGGGLPRKTWLLDHERRFWGPERRFAFA